MKRKAFTHCPVDGCGRELLYTTDSLGSPDAAVCKGAHEFKVVYAGALRPNTRERTVVYVPDRVFIDMIDFRAVFHNTCNRIDSPRQFFGGIRELVQRLADETDRDYEERGVEPYGNPMRRVDEKLAERGYGIGYGGC